MTSIEIPENQRSTPWVKSLVCFIQEQAKIIQTQAEQIALLKNTVQDLRDEITRLKNTPKRPKFKPPGKNLSSSSKGNQNVHNRNILDASQDTPIQKAREEIVVKPPHIPEGSRFKGYATYSVQELTITPKDMIYKLEVWQAPDGSIVRAAFRSGGRALWCGFTRFDSWSLCEWNDATRDFPDHQQRRH